jgi:hypothetical protein
MQKADTGLFIYSTGGKCRHLSVIMNNYYIYSQLFLSSPLQLQSLTTIWDIQIVQRKRLQGIKGTVA